MKTVIFTNKYDWTIVFISLEFGAKADDGLISRTAYQINQIAVCNMDRIGGSCIFMVYLDKRKDEKS